MVSCLCIHTTFEPIIFKKINRAKIIKLVNEELDAIGMGRHYKGRVYLTTIITIFITDNHESSDGAIKEAANEHNVGYSSIMRAVTTAIENTWYDCDPIVLKEQYTLHIGDKKKRPTNNEFIHYYAEKIINLMEADD